MARQRYCGRLARNRKPGASLLTRSHKPAAQTRAEKRGSRPSKAAAGERLTVCWREVDSNFRFRARLHYGRGRVSRFTCAVWLSDGAAQIGTGDQRRKPGFRTGKRSRGLTQAYPPQRPRPRRNFRLELEKLLETEFGRVMLHRESAIAGVYKPHKFDFVVQVGEQRRLLLDGVSPEASS
jgi:hypothetical protein